MATPVSRPACPLRTPLTLRLARTLAVQALLGVGMCIGVFGHVLVLMWGIWCLGALWTIGGCLLAPPTYSGSLGAGPPAYDASGSWTALGILGVLLILASRRVITLGDRIERASVERRDTS